MVTQQTAIQPVSAQELSQLPAGGRHALVKGDLRKMPPAGGEHGQLAMHVGASLSQAVTAQNLGRVYAVETGFLLASNPDTVLAPDAAFVRAERLAQITDVAGFIPGAPNLAVEVISPKKPLCGQGGV